MRAVGTRGTGARRSLTRLARRLDRAVHEPRALDWPDAVAWWPVAPEALGWLTRRARRSLAELAGAPETLAAIPSGCDAAHMATLTDLRHSADTHRHLREIGHIAGVDVHAPFLDESVVRACLAIAPADRADHADGHVGKPLLAAALRGRVPDAVFVGRAKGDYTREEYLGGRLAAPGLHRLLDESALAAWGVIEPSAVRCSVERLNAGVSVPLGPLRMLVATELWLRAGTDGG